MAKNENAQYRAMKALAMSSKGWGELLEEIPNDESEPYAVKRILEWVVKDSNWPEHERNTCFDGYRRALSRLLQSEGIWTASITSLEVLIETFAVMKVTPTQEEINAFKHAVTVTAKVVGDNLDDAESLEAEVDALNNVSKVCGFESKGELARLSTRLSALRDHCDDDDEGSNADRSRYQDSAEKYHDIDALFAGLLDASTGHA